MTWYWDRAVGRYRNPDGTFLSAQRVLDLRNAVVDKAQADARAISARLSSGEITSARFVMEMRDLIKTSYGAQYVFGRGGFKQMADSDWTVLGAEVSRQYRYLDGFSAAIVASANGSGPKLSEAQVSARADMYVNGGVQAHSRGLATAWGVDLPCHPGDGGTECLTACKCSWQIDVADGVKVATWVTGGSNPCTGCMGRAGMYQSLVLGSSDASE